MNKIIYVFTFLIFFNFSCVSPPEYTDGLLENNPAIINESDFFSLSIHTEDYTENEMWDLNLSLLDSDILLSTLIIKDLNISLSDSSSLTILGDNSDTLLTVLFKEEFVWTSIDTLSNYGFPQKAILKSDNLTARVEFQMLKL
tara:strand:+ start:82 stop:510 length:429 start_codon:yes stop_codon:yes gene_type:complete